MSDLLQKGSEWLGRQMRKHASREVIYQRGASSVSVPATPGASDFERDGGGFPVTFQSSDWLIDVADLELDGIPIEPARGDQIIDGELDEAVVYELLENLGGPPWKYADGSYRKKYRIHTKQVEKRP